METSHASRTTVSREAQLGAWSRRGAENTTSIPLQATAMPMPPATAVTLPPNPPRAAFKLPRYAGTVPPEPYLAQVRLAVLQNDCSAEETAVQVALERKALQVLLDLMPAQQRDYMTLAGALERRFGQRVSTDSMRDQLSHRRCREGETLGAYAADVQFYAQRGYPTFNSAACEELALYTFIQGLTPEWLKEHFRSIAPTTFNGALQEAERVDAVLMPCRPQRHQAQQVEISDEEPDDMGGTVCQTR